MPTLPWGVATAFHNCNPPKHPPHLAHVPKCLEDPPTQPDEPPQLSLMSPRAMMLFPYRHRI